MSRPSGRESLDRRDFFNVMNAAGIAALAKGLLPPQSFQLVEAAGAAPLPAKTPVEPFTFAYLSTDERWPADGDSLPGRSDSP